MEFLKRDKRKILVSKLDSIQLEQQMEIKEILKYQHKQSHYKI